MPFSFVPLGLPGVVLIEPRAFEDARGFFVETYKQSDFAAAGIPDVLVHVQRPPMAQGKLVRVLAGEIFDVAVDIRPDSPTFRQWTGVTLSAATRQLVYVPPWCAHGFCVLSESADVLYKTTAEYAPHLESGIAWDDPAVGITWPLDSPVLSDRDRRWPPLDTASGVSGPTGVTR
jgi:dTDP-4-dehydrorhamnose 3,5-epimerase